MPRRSVEDDDGTGGTARELPPLVVVRRIHITSAGIVVIVCAARHEARRAVVARERIDHQDEPDQRPRHVVTTHVDVQTLRGGAGFDSPPVEGTELEVLADDPTGGFEDRLVDIQRIEDRIAIDEVGDARRARRIGRRPDVDGIWPTRPQRRTLARARRRPLRVLGSRRSRRRIQLLERFVHVWTLHLSDDDIRIVRSRGLQQCAP